MILYLNREFHGGQRTRELDGCTVTCRLDKSPLVAGEAGRNQFLLEPLELGVGGLLSALQ
jgi:hypothetical protein